MLYPKNLNLLKHYNDEFGSKFLNVRVGDLFVNSSFGRIQGVLEFKNDIIVDGFVDTNHSIDAKFNGIAFEDILLSLEHNKNLHKICVPRSDFMQYKISCILDNHSIDLAYKQEIILDKCVLYVDRGVTGAIVLDNADEIVEGFALERCSGLYDGNDVKDLLKKIVSAHI